MALSLSELRIYPVKSAAGSVVRVADVDRFGLAGDRRWMLIDERGDFVTQRTQPRLCLVQATLTPSGLNLAATGFPPLDVATPRATPLRRVQVWADSCQGRDGGEAAALWLSRFLGMRVRLVHMPGEVRRPVDTAYAPPGKTVSFADGFPFLLISQASLAALNERLAEPVSMTRFRPNLVVSGGCGFQEDEWRRIRIGEVVFSVVKPCERCRVTTVDPATGERGREPLKTLAAFRRAGNQVLFGQNLVQENEGRLQVGDPVVVLA
ncbi:MOSC domain-containing protein [Motiliproteus sp. SC1-56]|uniref:MOSC domain-containing protein n=1 Tax=Motiliproteus sp. SC1-56 TaxID=2799565 RepID=UPI001A906302|nr:MOSC domain-containing protein [Motiliproteus sp. SC1-56]